MTETTDKKAIEELFSGLGKAHAERDADAIVACHAPDAVMFGLAPPLWQRGVKRDEIQAWLKTWDGPINIEGRNVELTVPGDAAFASALTRMRGSQKGKEVDFWFRMTQCLRKIDGRWLLVHNHASVPFHMDEDRRAALDLKP